MAENMSLSFFYFFLLFNFCSLFCGDGFCANCAWGGNGFCGKSWVLLWWVLWLVMGVVVMDFVGFFYFFFFILFFYGGDGFCYGCGCGGNGFCG